MLNHTLKLACAAALLGVSQLNAASLTASNITGGPGDIAVVNSSGSAISGGFTAIFQFTSAPGSAAALQANGNSGLLEQLALSAGNYPGGGAFSTVFGSIPNNGATAIGGPLYLVFGDGADVASSTELGMISLGISLDGDDTPTPDDLGVYMVDTADIAIGNAGAQTGLDWSLSTGQGSRDLSTFELAVIPEPSTALLSLFGLAALMRRRR